MKKKTIAFKDIAFWTNKLAKVSLTGYPNMGLLIKKLDEVSNRTHKRVFTKGARIRCVNTFEKWTKAGGWIFWGYQKRAVHPGWARSWQFQMVSNSLGRMWKAVRISKI